MLVVSATLAPGADVDAFHDWYDNVHLPDITSCPGFNHGVRYAWNENVAGSGRHFLALYDIDDPHVLDTDEFAKRRGFGPFSDQVTFTTRVYARHIPGARRPRE